MSVVWVLLMFCLLASVRMGCAHVHGYNGLICRSSRSVSCVARERAVRPRQGA